MPPLMQQTCHTGCCKLSPQQSVAILNNLNNLQPGKCGRETCIASAMQTESSRIANKFPTVNSNVSLKFMTNYQKSMILFNFVKTGQLHSLCYMICENTLVQGAPIKNNPLEKIHYLSYCNRFFHQIYSFCRGGFRP